MVPSTGGCSRYLFIPNQHEAPNPLFDELSGPLRGRDGFSERILGFILFGMSKYLDHPLLKAPFRPNSKDI